MRPMPPLGACVNQTVALGAGADAVMARATACVGVVERTVPAGFSRTTDDPAVTQTTGPFVSFVAAMSFTKRPRK